MSCWHLSPGSLAEHPGFLKPELSARAHRRCFLSFSLLTVTTIPHKAILTCRKPLADNKKAQFFNYKTMNKSLVKLLSDLVLFNCILTLHKKALEEQAYNKISTIPA